MVKGGIEVYNMQSGKVKGGSQNRNRDWDKKRRYLNCLSKY
jgi:hypothetical protein